MAGRGFLPAEPARHALEREAVSRHATVSGLARGLGLDRSTLYRLLYRENLRYDAADHIAVALGRHPCEIWPEWFDHRARERRR